MGKIHTVLKNVKSEETMREIGVFSRERIFKFAKSGKSLAEKTAKSFKQLAEVTKKIKKAWAGKGGRTGSFFGPNKSNLTATGQLLDALKYSYRKGDNKVKIFVDNTSRPIKGPVLRGQKEENLTNAQVARRVARDGRPFLGMDELGKQRIIQLVKRKLRDEIKKEFK